MGLQWGGGGAATPLQVYKHMKFAKYQRTDSDKG